MELRTLKYFLEIANEENMSAAARSINISQPALSKQVRDLEEELGQELFYRNGHRLILTDAGRILRRRAEEIVNLTRRIPIDLQGMLDEEIVGELHIGLTESNSTIHIENALRVIHASYPKVRIHIRNGNAPSIIRGIETGELDFGLVFLPVSLERYEYLLFPFENCGGVLTKKDSPLADKESISFEELKRLPLISTSRKEYEKPILDYLMGQDALLLDYVASYETPSEAKMLVKCGFGYCLTYNCPEYENDDQVSFIPVLGAETLSTALVWKSKQNSSQIGNIFINGIRKEIQ